MGPPSSNSSSEPTSRCHLCVVGGGRDTNQATRIVCVLTLLYVRPQLRWVQVARQVDDGQKAQENMLHEVSSGTVVEGWRGRGEGSNRSTVSVVNERAHLSRQREIANLFDFMLWAHCEKASGMMSISRMTRSK